MLIVKVDLDCHKCYEKMRKILCKLQDQERIRTISYDDKSKTIAIAGPFDPQRLACKIRCRGGKTVKDVQIIDVDGGGPPPSPPPGNYNNGKNKKHKEKLPPPAAEQPPPPPQPSSPPPEPAAPPEMPRSSSPPPPPPQPATPDRGIVSTMPAFHEEDRAMPAPAQAQLEAPPPPPSPKGNPHHQPPPVEYYAPPPQPPPPMMKPRPLTPPMPCPTTKPEPYPSECVIPTVEIPSWPAAPVGPCGCPCCRPCYQGYYEGCRCGCAGNGARLYTGPPRPAWCGYGPYGYRGCRIINEEDPNAACTIM
ncbi:hypothetical protein QOZ80_9BG0714890 [Eleusine coracana subsp. coracana]|nr:hypothetical protein QOZ80_9BG0714890 [Eleusine coracana subsp. coracana]